MPRPLTVRKNGFVLESGWSPGDRLRCHFRREPADPPAGGGPVLAAVPLVPAANAAFPAGELDARIAALSRRLVGCPDDRRGETLCWACGRQAPCRGRVALARVGWRSRRIRLGTFTRVFVEVYCPACFARWGWPGGEDCAVKRVG